MSKFFLNILLLPILPFLGWGPVTHLYLHKKAIDEIEDPTPDKSLSDDASRALFIAAGNIADLIKANQLRYKERYYEYAHNTIPTSFHGRPVFGERLYEENCRLKRREGVVYSLGWICHQVADQFAHRYPTNFYEGFSNARLMFGRYYPADEEDYSEPAKSIRNDLISADHWLTEIFADMRCLAAEPEFFRKLALNLDFGEYPEVEKLSAGIIEDYRDALFPAVKYFIPLKPDVLRRVYRYYHMLIKVFLDMYFHFFDKLGPEGVRAMLDEFTPLSGLDRMLDKSLVAIKGSLEKPVGGWHPGKFIAPEDAEVRYSVYSYEQYDGPERYDFGFRRGLIPMVSSIFSNNRYFNEIAMRATDHISTWPVISRIIGLASMRRRSGLNITAHFIKEMDKGEEPVIEELVRSAALRFKLSGEGL